MASSWANLSSSLEGRLLFAIPKKGRLLEKTLQLLEGADISFHRSPRLDIALVKNHPIALIFLPAAEIPFFVGEGRLDLGITGWDQIVEYESCNHTTIPQPQQRESDVAQTNGASEPLKAQIDGVEATAEQPPSGDQEKQKEFGWEEVVIGERANMKVLMDLGFGKCKLQIQVPQNGTIQHPRQLIGKRVCTSFEGITKRYFAQLEAGQEGKEAGPAASREEEEERRQKLTKNIKYLGGSVEITCALGEAAGIADLVESGATMEAAGLHPIATLLTSSAVLISSTHASNPALVKKIAARLLGKITAQRYVYVQYNISREGLAAAEKIAPGKKAPTVNALDSSDWVAVSIMVAKTEEAEVLDRLEAVGATEILVHPLGNTRAC